MSDEQYDIEFFFDPVCPFAWITSRWIVKVEQQTDYKVDWRFISLRLLNSDKNYDTDFPEGYDCFFMNKLKVISVVCGIESKSVFAGFDSGSMEAGGPSLGIGIAIPQNTVIQIAGSINPGGLFQK